MSDATDEQQAGSGNKSGSGRKARADQKAVADRQAASDVDALGYEQARAELVDTVRRLEQGGATLEESLALWERGEQLAAACQRWLDGARKRLDAVVDGNDAPD